MHEGTFLGIKSELNAPNYIAKCKKKAWEIVEGSLSLTPFLFYVVFISIQYTPLFVCFSFAPHPTPGQF